MKVRRFTHVPVTTTSSSPTSRNGKKFQTVLTESVEVNGKWATDTSSVNCGSTDFRVRKPGRRYQIETDDGTEFVTKSQYNVLRAKEGLEPVR